MHQMQDFFSHYGQGYQANTDLVSDVSWWNPGAAAGTWLYFLANWGHGCDTATNDYLNRYTDDYPSGLGLGLGLRPDNADDFRKAFNAAYERTQFWLKRWEKCCHKIMESWHVTQEGNKVIDCTLWDKKQKRPPECCAPIDYTNYPWADRAPPGIRAL
jgi:hypothetical protein